MNAQSASRELYFLERYIKERKMITINERYFELTWHHQASSVLRNIKAEEENFKLRKPTGNQIA